MSILFLQMMAQSKTMISPPVGEGILPGSGDTASDIQSSLLFSKIIPFLIEWGINLAFGLSVIFIIIGGYQYLTAYGNDDQRQAGTRTLYYSIIGLILAITAYGIV